MGVNREATEVREVSAGYMPQGIRPAVPEGYKQTEVGVIPEDWDVRSIYDIAERQKSLFDDGDWVEAEHITNKGVRLIQTGNIGIGGYVEKSIKKYIYETSFEKLKCKELAIGDLLICRLAEPAGRACLLPDLGEEKVITSVDVTIFRPSEEVADRRFLVQYFSTRDWFESVLNNVGGTTHKRISRGALGKIPVPVPPVDEQRAIATTLSDVDALLEGLDRLIAKKRDLKQAAMQQLLTGQTRLPGFGGEWETMALAEGISLYSGHHVMAKYCDTSGHGTPYLTGPADFPRGRIRQKRFTTQPTTLCHAGDILVTVKGSGAGTLTMADDEYCISRQLMAVRPELFDRNFLFYSLLQNASRITEAVAGLIPGLSRSDILGQELPVPPTNEEQTAVASVLSDMDAELDALERRRAKTVALKQAMMQELLTGRTRLVEPGQEEAAAC